MVNVLRLALVAGTLAFGWMVLQSVLEVAPALAGIR